MIQETNSGDIRIVNVDNLENYQSLQDKLDGFHLIVIDEWQPGLLRYPTKISFELTVPKNIEDYLAQFPSSRRSSIRKRRKDIEAEYEIRVIEDISQEDFNDWNIGYQHFINSMAFGRYNIESNWFETKAQSHTAIMFYKANALCGGVMLKRLIGKLSMSYAWYSQSLRSAGGPTCAVLVSLEYAMKKEYAIFAFGQDTNLFGGHLQLGLHDYKKSWLSIPYVPRKSAVKGIIIKMLPAFPFLLYIQNEIGNLSAYTNRDVS